ncbi:MAG: potassium/proton antiporter [Candidatus Fimivivens sp.]
MPLYLLLAAFILITCVAFNKLSSKLGIPVLLAFILLGMLFGAEGIVKIPFDDYAFAGQICAVALVFIMFYGGFGTRWSEAKPVAVQAMLLSSVGVVLTTGITGLFCYFVLQINFLESFLIGAVISSTDAASVFSILRSKRLNLKHNTASMLEVESGSNDPCAYMLTIVILSIMSGSAKGGQITYMIFAQLTYGVVLGVAIAAAALWALKKFRFAADGFDAIFILGVAILSYAAPEAVGGNGYLSAYIVGIIMGNHHIRNKKAVVNFFDTATGLMQVVLFFLLGLLATPSLLINVAFTALAIALFLTFVARPVAVFAILAPFRSTIAQQQLVAWSGLRGAASIVFAVMATIHSAYTSTDLFHIVFFIVLLSILIQGSMIPFVARRLDMIDENADVMKTFTDYSDEVPIQFIQFSIPESHPWANSMIQDILLPAETILVLLLREGQKIVPNGQTVLQAGDKLVLSAKAPGKIEGISLFEKHVGKGHKWENKCVSEIFNKPDMLIIMVQRKDRVIIPHGSTIIKENDVLVINHAG